MVPQTLLTKDWAVQPIVDPALPLGRALDFELPAHLSASEPPEARGLARDEVRLMVSYRSSDAVHHTQFRQMDTEAILSVMNKDPVLIDVRGVIKREEVEKHGINYYCL